jgi:hypothetical protein
MTVPYDIVTDILRVITTISQGYQPTVACDMCHVAYTTFTTYTKAGSRYPQLVQMRQEAEDRLYDLMAEALPRIYDHHIYGVQRDSQASVISGNIKWLLERRRQKSYGAHSSVEVNITADREVIEALQRAKARAQGAIIDSSVKETTDVLIDRSVNITDIEVVDEFDVSSCY